MTISGAQKDIAAAFTMFGPMDLNTLRRKLNLRGRDLDLDEIEKHCEDLLENKVLYRAEGFRNPAFKIGPGQW